MKHMAFSKIKLKNGIVPVVIGIGMAASAAFSQQSSFFDEPLKNKSTSGDTVLNVQPVLTVQPAANVQSIVKKDENDYEKIRELHVLKQSDIFYLIRVMGDDFKDKRMVIPVSSKYWSSVDEVVDKLKNFFKIEGKDSIIVTGIAKTQPVIGYVTIDNTSKPEPSNPKVIKTEIKNIQRVRKEVESQAPELADVLDQRLESLYDRLNNLDERISTLERKTFFDDKRLSRIESAIDSLGDVLNSFPDEYELAGQRVTHLLKKEKEHKKRVEKLTRAPVRRIRVDVRASENNTSFEFETGSIVSFIISARIENGDISVSTSEYAFGMGVATPRMQFDITTVNTVHERKDTVVYKPLVLKNSKYSLTLRDVRGRIRIDIPLGISSNGHYWWVEPEISYYSPVSYPYDPKASKVSFSTNIFYGGIGIAAGSEVENFSKPEVTPFVGFSVSF